MKALSYADINLLPNKCIVDSRKECDTSVQFGPMKFDMPVYASNMKSVVNEDTCIFFAKNNWFYTMHRFGVDPVAFCSIMQDLSLYISISAGVNEDSYEQLLSLKRNGFCPDYITIDVANAWSDKTRRMAEYIKENFPRTFLIVGNIATGCAAADMERWGTIDAIKVGQAAGSVCITRHKTGFSRPMVTTILDCVSRLDNTPIIADGGICEHGDIAKAISLGAKMVMAGSLFAGYDQSAGQVIEIEDKMYKEYYGSASKYNKDSQTNIEGKKILIPYKGDMFRLIRELKEDLQSSISYAGGKKLDDLQFVQWETR
ncbi:MAG: GMP reductase [Phenylobacterium sp.]